MAVRHEAGRTERVTDEHACRAGLPAPGEVGDHGAWTAAGADGDTAEVVMDQGGTGHAVTICRACTAPKSLTSVVLPQTALV
jgi:hypothetical protein